MSKGTFRVDVHLKFNAVQDSSKRRDLANVMQGFVTEGQLAYFIS
jgi:hypothetical protein